MYPNFDDHYDMGFDQQISNQESMSPQDFFSGSNKKKKISKRSSYKFFQDSLKRSNKMKFQQIQDFQLQHQPSNQKFFGSNVINNEIVFQFPQNTQVVPMKNMQTNNQFSLLTDITNSKKEQTNNYENSDIEMNMNLQKLNDIFKERNISFVNKGIETPYVQKIDNKNAFKQVTTVPCKCSKSKCIKGYCDCYNNGKQCSSSCICTNCKNRTFSIYKEFKTTTITDNTASNKIKEISKSKVNEKHVDGTPHVHKDEKLQGCKCKKTQCRKKYCECFQKNQPCNENCNCTECENTHENKIYLTQKKKRKVDQECKNLEEVQQRLFQNNRNNQRNDTEDDHIEEEHHQQNEQQLQQSQLYTQTQNQQQRQVYQTTFTENYFMNSNSIESIRLVQQYNEQLLLQKRNILAQSQQTSAFY